MGDLVGTVFFHFAEMLQQTLQGTFLVAKFASPQYSFHKINSSPLKTKTVGPQGDHGEHSHAQHLHSACIE